VRYLASIRGEDELSELEVDFFFDHLACEVDERAVLSAICRESGGIVRLQYASLLVGLAKWRMDPEASGFSLVRRRPRLV